jgi:hypothetical protein
MERLEAEESKRAMKPNTTTSAHTPPTALNSTSRNMRPRAPTTRKYEADIRPL